jgi:dTDP-4-dehydrorhamnose reductase
MKILLLGKNGQLGWELQRSLVLLGEVHAFGRQASGGSGTDQADGVDFSKPEQLASLVRSVAPDVIVNAAAHTAVDLCESEPELAHAINAEAPAVLAKAARERGAWLVHYSSDYVFDGSGDQFRSEDAPAQPLNVYGHSKWAGEELIRQSACRHLIFRTSWVYALRGGNFARTMLRLAAERDTLRVINDQWGAPTSADLLADVTAHALRSVVRAERSELSGTYNTVAAGVTNWHAYASYVIERARRAGATIQVQPDAIHAVPGREFPLPAQRPLNSRLNTRKLCQTFGLHLPHWQHGVDRMLAQLVGPGK